MSDDWLYAIGIIKFQGAGDPADDASGIKVSGDVADVFNGLLCQAARQLLKLSQDDLRQLAGVSRKTINDFENGSGHPSPGIMSELAGALQAQGAQFIRDGEAFGVRVALDRARFTERSRASRSGSASPAGGARTSRLSSYGSSVGEPRRPGRPRKGS